MPDRVLALSAGPLTRPAAAELRRLLADRWDVREYQTDGRGGRALEADVLAGRVAAWHDQGRPRASALSVIAYPLGTPVAGRPGQTVLDRPHTRLILSWPPPGPPSPPPQRGQEE